MDGLQIERIAPKTWIWIHQTSHGGFYRSPKTYPTKTAADKAGRAWLTRRANPRMRGR